MIKSVRKLSLPVFLGLLTTFNGCKDPDSDIAPDSNISVSNDESALNERVSSYNDTLEVEEADASGGRKKKDFDLILEKSLSSPAVEGNTLQATSVFYDQGKLLVSYNFRGEKYFGGAEYLTPKFKLTSQILYNDADINALVSDDKYVYLTGGVSADIPARVMKVSVQGNTFWQDEAKAQVLGSFAGTSLHLTGNDLYVTTGDDETSGGGVYHLDEQLNIKAFVPLHDARWIVESRDRFFVAQGTPGKVTVLDKSSLNIEFSFTFKGADLAASKTTIEVADDRIFIAGGPEGVQIHSASDGSFLHEITFSDGNITNAVTAEDGLLFISNGEGGLHVASYSNSLTEAPQLLGKILFDNSNESVNHVLHRNGSLYVATGLGGIKLITVRNK